MPWGKTGQNPGVGWHLAQLGLHCFCPSLVEPSSFLRYYTGLFISPSGISELDCATTKTDTAESNISSTCKLGQELEVSLSLSLSLLISSFLLICSFLPCLSWLLRSRVRKSRRDLGITLYISLETSLPFLPGVAGKSLYTGISCTQRGHCDGLLWMW